MTGATKFDVSETEGHTEMAKTESEILPCPFCGGAAETVYIRDGRQVTCRKCHAYGPAVFHGKAGFDATDGLAIEAWNRRAANSDGGVEQKPDAWLVSAPDVDPLAVTGENTAKYGIIQGWDVRPLFLHPPAKALDGIAVTDLMVRRVCSEAQKWGRPIKADAARALIEAALAVR